MEHDSLWKLAYSGKQTDDKHANIWKKWHEPIIPYSCAYQTCIQGCGKK